MVLWSLGSQIPVLLNTKNVKVSDFFVFFVCVILVSRDLKSFELHGGICKPSYESWYFPSLSCFQLEAHYPPGISSPFKNYIQVKDHMQIIISL